MLGDWCKITELGFQGVLKNPPLGDFSVVKFSVQLWWSAILFAYFFLANFLLYFPEGFRPIVSFVLHGA